MARKFFEVKNYAKRSEANSFWEFKEKQYIFFILIITIKIFSLTLKLFHVLKHYSPLSLSEKVRTKFPTFAVLYPPCYSVEPFG